MNSESNHRDPLEELAAEFLDRFRDGEPASIDAYAAQYPELADAIRELFPTIVALEQTKREDQKFAARNATLRPLQLAELGDFKILREIGRGGMGIVYAAEQRSLDRQVALKVLPKQSLLDPMHLRRFQREARIAARLHHTNIVSLYGTGEHDGFHFLVMELIDGVSLDKVIGRIRELDAGLLQESDIVDSNPQAAIGSDFDHLVDLLCPREPSQYFANVARIGRDAAHALQHASDREVLHRDIKPGNLILDSDGNIWISDFGLAQALSATDVSNTQSLSGTLAYMPPEGFSGKSDIRSDLYSLGLTVYELLTLEPAYCYQTHTEALKQIADESISPKPPSILNAAIPRDLETVVLKAIAKDPARRYESAGDLANDLQRFLENRPVSARRVSSIERLWRWCNRNRAIAALAALATSSLALVAVVMTVSFFQVRQSNRSVQSALFSEKEQREQSEAMLNLATSALDGIYEKFAPGDLQDRSETTSGLSKSAAGKTTRPALSVETAIILENLLKFYDRLANESGRTSQVSEAASRALCRVGDIHRQLGQMKKSLDQYTAALKTLSSFKEEHPDRADLNVEMARIHNEIGRVQFVAGDYESARVSHRYALRTLAESKELQDLTSARYEQARSHYYLGRKEKLSAPLVATAQLAGGDAPPPEMLQDPTDPVHLEHLQSAVDLLEAMMAGESSSPACQFLLACSYRELRPRVENFPLEQMVDHSHRPIEILRELLGEFPENQYYRFELVESLRFALPPPPHLAEGRGGVVGMLEDALLHADYLVERHPNVPKYAMARMHVLHKLGHTLTREARHWDRKLRDDLFDEASYTLEEAREQIRKITKRWPDVLSYQVWSIVVDGSLAQVYLDIEELNDARIVLHSSLSTLDRLTKDGLVDEAITKTDLLPIYEALLGLAERTQDNELVQDVQSRLDSYGKAN